MTGGEPATWHASNSNSASSHDPELTTGIDERGKTPVLVIDEAHLLRYEQLETIRMLTLCRDRDYAGDLHVLPGFATGSSPTVPA